MTMSDCLRDRIAAAIKKIDDMRACKLSNAEASGGLTDSRNAK